MPRDDRDQNFEKALARSLRSSKAVPGNDCSDAEALAAYHERLLDPDEMAQRKAHIASCDRCQEILAQLEATDLIPVEADRDLLLDQIILDIPETEPADAASAGAKAAEPAPTDEITAPLAETAPAQPAEPKPEPAPEHEPELVAASAAAPSVDLSRPGTLFPSAAKSSPSSATITFRAPRSERPRIVRFVALAGALAAGLILWLVYRDQANKNFELAQNHAPSKLEMPPQSPAPAPPAEANQGASSAQTESSDKMLASPQSSVAPAASAPLLPSPAPSQPSPESDAVANALKDAKKAVDSAKALQQKSPGIAGDLTAGRVAPPAARTESKANNAYADRDLAAAEARRAARKREAANEPANALSLGGAVPVTDAAANVASGIPTTPPPARTKMTPGVVTESADSIAAPLTPVSTSAQNEALSKPVNGRIVAALTPLSVPAPSGTTIWRIGQAGVIQRSTDSGTTWSIQPSGVVTDLIAGSAYSDQICWLVGRNGTILRTTNGGATWQKIASPSNVDLLSIFAINADSATITDAAGRAFETTSGGAHWTRTRLQQ